MWIIGNAVLTDIGFFVPRGIFEKRNRGIYGSALIKKRRYWPMGINLDAINDYYRSKHIGDVGYLSGECDNTEYFLKEPD